MQKSQMKLNFGKAIKSIVLLGFVKIVYREVILSCRSLYIIKTVILFPMDLPLLPNLSAQSMVLDSNPKVT